MKTCTSRMLLIVTVAASLWPCAAFALRPYGSAGGGCPFCGGGDFPTADELGLPAAPKAKEAPAVAPAPSAAAPVAPNLVSPSKPVLALASKSGLTPPPVEQGPDGYWRISFLNLASFDFVAPPPDAPPAPGSLKDIPENIRTLDGRRVLLSGYMLPIRLENGLVTECLLVRSPMMCCYGVVPAPNEWVVVKMKGAGVGVMMDTPVKFYGTLRVGGVYEDKTFAGIYQLDGEKVSAN